MLRVLLVRAHHWHDGSQFRLAVVVRELRKRAEILVIESTGTGPRLRLRRVPLEELPKMVPVDAGARGQRKMATSLRRLARKPGTAKVARQAVKAVLA